MLFALEMRVSAGAAEPADGSVPHLALLFLVLSLIPSVNNFRRLSIHSGEAGVLQAARLAAGAGSNHSPKLSNTLQGSRLISG